MSPANPTADQEDFKRVEKFSYGDVSCMVNDKQPYFIDVTINADCLSVKEARALRDWLNVVLP
ncbi:MAG TPA: hypothetical protein VK626_01755 [Nitrospiraceae bacterium]|nr:hypothetical protein [Nitrospiraceae bacterium]